MLALVTTPDAPSGLALEKVPDPVAAAGELVVDVAHSSLNHGEVVAARSGGATGAVSGWDASGVVGASAADGSGPPAGERVVTFGYGGAWAQRRAVAASETAVVPDSVDLAVAAALPVAGVTALQALRRSGSLLGKRVLITGASGGVGRFAVQLAARAGAHVVAAARRGEGLADLGASEVVADLDGLDPVDVVIENVGGPVLVQAWERLSPGGILQSVGWTSGEPATLAPYGTVGPAKSLVAFQVAGPFGPDLAYLLDLVARGALTVDVGWRGSWRQIDDATNALLDRNVIGKAVIDID
ncbi:MAG TPA: zinc-binding dehydrogenase [Acidimicrobiia bacterium]